MRHENDDRAAMAGSEPKAMNKVVGNRRNRGGKRSGVERWGDQPQWTSGMRRLGDEAGGEDDMGCAYCIAYACC